MKRLFLIMVAGLLLAGVWEGAPLLWAQGEKAIKPGPKDKCPVCGMFVAKYPDFVAILTFKDGGKVIHHYKIGLHTQFVGEIIDTKIDESVLDGDGGPDIEKIRPLIFSPGAQNYHGIGEFIGKAFKVGKKAQ